MKDYRLTVAILVITNIFFVVLFIISTMFWKDCYNTMQDLEKKLYEEQKQVELLEDVINQFKMDVDDCDVFIKFYDEFHEEVGAFE